MSNYPYTEVNGEAYNCANNDCVNKRVKLSGLYCNKEMCKFQ